MEKSSALDTEIQRSVWNAVIPIELKLAPDDLATPVAPDPYYVWRYSVFGFFSDLLV